MTRDIRSFENGLEAEFPHAFVLPYHSIDDAWDFNAIVRAIHGNPFWGDFHVDWGYDVVKIHDPKNDCEILAGKICFKDPDKALLCKLSLVGVSDVH